MVLVVEVMGGVRYDPSTFPDGLFFMYGCESGLWLSNDLPLLFMILLRGHLFTSLRETNHGRMLKVTVD